MMKINIIDVELNTMSSFEKRGCRKSTILEQPAVCSVGGIQVARIKRRKERVIMSVLDGLEPAGVFHYFEEICGIPHGSGDTKAISDYCVTFAKKHNFKYRQDEYNNVIIWKDGTPGYEQSAPVMIQGHLDMVCEKEPDCDLDFREEGIRVQLEDGIISAQGTTLGGDDGIAVAYALAILDSKDIPHPPLEVVFTVDEEIGMLGASAMDCSPLKSKILLNLDSEEEGYLLVSCAGGVTAKAELPVVYESCSGVCMEIKVTGLKGGHSGVEIDKGRGNACQLLGRVLYTIRKSIPFALCRIEGGLKDNAIPREARAEILVSGEVRKKIENMAGEITKVFQHEFRITDPDVKVSCEDSDASYVHAMTEVSTSDVIAALMNLPGGIQRMSFEIEGLVQTSLNLGIMTTEEGQVSFSFSVRSSVETEKKALVDQMENLMDKLGGTVSCSGEYPAWEYCPDSSLRDLMVEIYEEQYGEKPIIQALHAGVECGIFAGKLPGLDCVSFGPDMKDIHTPKESMDVASVKRTWEYTLEILKRLK